MLFLEQVLYDGFGTTGSLDKGSDVRWRRLCGFRRAA